MNGLHEQIEAAFMISDAEKQELIAQAHQRTRVQRDEALHVIRLNQLPGLKTELALAYIGGDEHEIAGWVEVAQDHARSGFFRKVAVSILERGL